MIIITGQTATGKTKLALEFAQKYNGELINFECEVFFYENTAKGAEDWCFC